MTAAAIRMVSDDVAIPMAPLSDLHAMLGRIERVRDAGWRNRVANDQDVIDEIKGYHNAMMLDQLPVIDAELAP